MGTISHLLRILHIFNVSLVKSNYIFLLQPIIMVSCCIILLFPAIPPIPFGCSLVWSLTFDHLVLTHFLLFTLCDKLLTFHWNQRHSWNRNQVHVQSYLCQFPRLLSSIMSKHVFSSFAIKAFAQDWSKGKTKHKHGITRVLMW